MTNRVTNEQRQKLIELLLDLPGIESVTQREHLMATQSVAMAAQARNNAARPRTRTMPRSCDAKRTTALLPPL